MYYNGHSEGGFYEFSRTDNPAHKSQARELAGSAGVY